MRLGAISRLIMVVRPIRPELSIFVENISDYDLELALLRVGIAKTDIYDPWIEKNDPRVNFIGL